MQKKLQVGDIIYLTDVSETYEFEVVRVTETVAIAEERPFELFPEPFPNPSTEQLRFNRNYEVDDVLSGWKFFKGLRNIPYKPWWLQFRVEPKETE